MMETILICISVLALIFAVIKSGLILRKSSGTEKMQEISKTGITAISDSLTTEQDQTAADYIEKLNYTIERDITSLKTVKNLLKKSDKEFEEEMEKIVENLREASKYELNTIQRYTKSGGK